MLVKIRNAVRDLFVTIRVGIYRNVWKMDIGEHCVISSSAKLDRTNPKGIHIGRYTGIAFGSAILTHNFIDISRTDTYIGERCHIGANSIIMPGVRIGNGCIVAAGSVVMKDVEDNCIVAGNPARVIERNIVVGPWGIRAPHILKQYQKQFNLNIEDKNVTGN